MGTGRERSQGCAHTDNCPWMVSQAAAAALPSPVREEAKTIMWDKQSKCQHGLLLQHPVSVMLFDGRGDQNGNSSSSLITCCFFLT